MNSIVVLTHSRPECLWLCLESLKAVRGLERYRVIIATNEDCHPEIPTVVRDQCNGQVPYQLVLRPTGQLIDEANGEAFKLGADRSDDFFLELAEDEIVSRDWLGFMEYVAGHFRLPDTLGVAGAFAVFPFKQRPYPDNLIFRSQGFTTQGSLIFTEPFNRLVRPYLTPEYYVNAYGDVGGLINHRREFFLKHFPDQQPINMGVDGLITKVMRREHLHSYLPLVPRVSQVGFAGAHMQANRALWDATVTGGDPGGAGRVPEKLIETGRIASCFGDWRAEYHAIKPDHQWVDIIVASDL